MASPTQNYYHDGDGDYITVNDNAAFDVTASIGIGCWLSRDYDNLGANSYLMHRNGTFSLYLDAFNRVAFEVSGVTPVLTSTSKVRSEHIMFVSAVAVEVGTTLVMEIYVNGDLDASQTVAAAAMPAATNTAVLFGAYHTPASYFKGSLSSFFMVSDRVTAEEMRHIYNSSSGQITGYLDNVIIDIDCEGDLVNSEGGTVPDGVATGALLRTYMNLWQSQSKNDGTIVVPEAEALYNTHKQVLLNGIHWYGDTIADGDKLSLTNWAGLEIFGVNALADDTGGYWVFDKKLFQGLKLATLTHGIVQLDIA